MELNIVKSKPVRYGDFYLSLGICGAGIFEHEGHIWIIETDNGGGFGQRDAKWDITDDTMVTPVHISANGILINF
jgi:hypothetical protein